MQSILPTPEVGEVLKSHYVMVAVDADEPDPEAMRLAMEIPDAMMLPIVVVATPDLDFCDGFSGARSRAAVQEFLEKNAP